MQRSTRHEAAPAIHRHHQLTWLVAVVTVMGCSTAMHGSKAFNRSAGQLLDGEIAAIAYSGYRTGQHPNKPGPEFSPTDAQLREDLKILSASGFRLIRMYGAGEMTARTLDIIRKDKLDIRVMLGAWLTAELSNHDGCEWLTEPIPAAALERNRVANEQELERAIILANTYPEVIVAVNVGNEALVSWTDHLVSLERFLEYASRVKGQIRQPVTTADNYMVYWKHGARLAAVLDFFTVHTYPVWEGKSVEEAAAYTIENLDGVRSRHPGVAIVIGEAGWASEASEFGPRASESAQKQYVDWLLGWSAKNHVTTFVFEAFDEDWKGNPLNPDGAEKHWGLWDIHRRPKEVIREKGDWKMRR